MGRPINSRYFGPDAGGDGFQITGSAWFPGEIAAEACFIVKQTASRRFLIEGSLSGKQMEAQLGGVTPAAEGDFAVLVNGSEHAKKITAHRVCTHEGNVFVWDDIIDAADSPTDVVDADLGDDTDNN